MAKTEQRRQAVRPQRLARAERDGRTSKRCVADARNASRRLNRELLKELLSGLAWSG